MRNFTVHDVEQGTPEWHALRVGRLTSSRAADMLREIKSGEAASRRNLRVKIVLERITGTIEQDAWTSRPVERGHELEPRALAAYEALTGELVTSCGIAIHDKHQAAASPDGVVGDFEGIVEAKCPLAATHLHYLKSGTVPGDYQAQNVHLMWITGAHWVDWISYHPDFPENLQSKLVRVERDEEAIAAYEAKALEFLAEVDAEELLVRGMAFGKAHAA